VIPDRFTAYLFDDMHIKFQDLSRARDAVWRNIQESMAPEFRVAVLTTSHRVVLDFTDDLEKLHQALFRIQPTRVYRQVGDMGFMGASKIARGDREALQMAMAALRGSTLATGSALEMYTEAAATRAVAAGERETELCLHTIRDLSRRMNSMAGRRTMVMLGHGFLVPWTQQGELGDTLDRAIRAGVVIHTFQHLRPADGLGAAANG
jgi:VWFA-related protein